MLDFNKVGWIVHTSEKRDEVKYKLRQIFLATRLAKVLAAILTIQPYFLVHFVFFVKNWLPQVISSAS
jgi:hypothetical protein